MRTQAPDFWNDAKQAEKVMKQVRELKGWIEGCEAAAELNFLVGTENFGADFHPKVADNVLFRHGI